MRFPQRIVRALLGALLFAVPAAAFDTDQTELQRVLEARCTQCHTLERVGIALDQGRDMDQIVEAMIARGAILPERDKQILGTFWGPSSRVESTPPEPLAPAITSAQAKAFAEVIERRCLLCHNRERIDEAIARRLPFEPIDQMMRRRGAVLTPEEQETLKIFWESPHR